MISNLILETSQRYNALVKDCHRLQPGEEVHMIIEGRMFVVRPAAVRDLERYPKLREFEKQLPLIEESVKEDRPISVTVAKKWLGMMLDYIKA